VAAVSEKNEKMMKLLFRADPMKIHEFEVKFQISQIWATLHKKYTILHDG